MKDRDNGLSIEQATLRASYWLSRLERGDLVDQAEFYDWLRERPMHAREFLAITWLDIELQRFGSAGEISQDELISRARAPGPATHRKVCRFRRLRRSRTIGHD